MTRKFVISLSILFFVLSGIIIFKALGIPVKNTYYKNNLEEFKSNDLSSESKDISMKNHEERDADKALIEELQNKIAILEKKLSNKNIETKVNVESSPEEHNISVRENTQINKNQSKELFYYSQPDDKNTFKQNVNADPQDASQKIYTIQTGSLTNIQDAIKELNSILQTLNGNDLNLLRIEKIGKFYTVRLGKFDDYSKADKFLQKIKPNLSSAVILDAYIIDNRIIELYGNDQSAL